MELEFVKPPTWKNTTELSPLLVCQNEECCYLVFGGNKVELYEPLACRVYGVTLALERTPGVGTICTIYTRAHFALPRAPVLHIRLSCRVHLAGFLRRRASRGRGGGAAQFNLCRTRNTFDRSCDAKCSIKIKIKSRLVCVFVSPCE